MLPVPKRIDRPGAVLGTRHQGVGAEGWRPLSTGSTWGWTEDPGGSSRHSRLPAGPPLPARGPSPTRSPWALSGLRGFSTFKGFARGLRVPANQALCVHNGCAPEVLPPTDQPPKPSLRFPLVILEDPTSRWSLLVPAR